jgi:hypothetical protein
VRKKLGGGDEKKKQKARQGASLTGHELISVRDAVLLFPRTQADDEPSGFSRNSLLVFSLWFSSKWQSWIETNEVITASLFL